MILLSEESHAEVQAPPQQHHHAQQKKGVLESVVRYTKSDRFRLYLTVFVIYTIITLVMFWYLVPNITSYVPNGSSDSYQSMWNLWWAPYSIFYLHTLPYFTYSIFFPIGANLVTQDLSPLAGILSAPFQAVSLAFAYNVIFLLGFILSGLFTFMLLLYLTGNKYASFIGSLVFAYSPMHIAQSIGHLNWASIEFIPLFILLFILMIKEKRQLYVVGSALSFLFVVFFGDPLQGVLTIVFVVLAILVYLLLKRKTALLNRGTILLLAEMCAIILVVGSPFLVPITLGLISPSTQSTASQLSGTVNQMLWSDNLASYFLPSYYNGIFSNISQSYYNAIYGLIYQNVIYTSDITEKVSYLGYSVLFLAIVALYFDFKKHRLANTALWLILLLIFGWLSLGPYLQVLGTVTSIPAIYSIYSNIPLLNIVREPGRFDALVTLCLAVLAAMGFAYLSEKMDRRKTTILAAVFFVLIMVEYNGMPLSSQFAQSLLLNATISKAYYQIGDIQGNFSVLILPIVLNTNSTSPEFYPSVAMYDSAAMNGKPIIGGYTSRENDTQVYSAEAVPLASAAGYLEEGYGLIFPSPVIGNVTNETLLWVENYDTQFVTVTRSAYNLSEQATLYNYLYDTFGTPLYVDNSTFVFQTKNAILEHANKALTAYSIGTWIPGYSFCSGESCNSTFGTLWWGTNERGIGIYSPNSMRVTMNLTAEAPINGTDVLLYLNNVQFGSLTVNENESEYGVSFNVSRGYNQVVFYAQNNTFLPSPYIVYGIKNVTVTRTT